MSFDPKNPKSDEELAQIIKDYWARRGALVSVKVIAINEGGYYVGGVRSDMVNGWPRYSTKDKMRAI
jgi:hypothetical protein